MIDYRPQSLAFSTVLSALLLISLFSLAACEQPREDLLEDITGIDGPTAPTPEPESEPEPDRDVAVDDPIEAPQVCYIGDKVESSTCFMVLSSDEVVGEVAGYDYLDPRRDQSFPSGWNPLFYEAPPVFFDLVATNPYEQIAPNFQLREVMEEYKGDFGYFSPYVIEKLQEMRSYTNSQIRINSAFRGPTYNHSVGGAKWSRHLHGDAVDLYISGMSISEMASLCRNYGADFTQAYTSHVHCDWRWTARIKDFPYEEELAVQNLANLRLNQLSTLSSQTQIVIIEGQLDTNSELLLGIETIHSEESEALLNNWTVKTPSGESIKNVSTRLTIQKLETGEYHVKALAGGSIPTTYSFVVP